MARLDLGGGGAGASVEEGGGAPADPEEVLDEPRIELKLKSLANSAFPRNTS